MISIRKIKQFAGSHWHNIPGWRTNRKIVVFESDDWGSIRMPSKAVYDLMLKKGYPVDIRPFEKYDTLESSEDLELLFNVLSEYKDSNGNSPILTANFIMTNPDFAKIRNTNFGEYHGENFTETYKKYFGNQDALNKIKEGILKKHIHPQYHGFTHFNYLEWMKALQSGATDEIFCFDKEMVGIPSSLNPDRGNQLMIALAFKNLNQFNEQRNNIIEGAKIFETIFGYKSRSFIAPVYTWNSAIENDLAAVGIKYIQGGRYQKEPVLPDGKIHLKKHTLGDSNNSGQIYLVRNAYFEPATNDKKAWVNDTAQTIQASFYWNKPAIISTHRLNYTGSIYPENRQSNLHLLSLLLKTIVTRWPDVEFMSTDQLGDLIFNIQE